MYTRCYKQKKSSQFIDFINKVDSLCHPSIKQVFIVLDKAFYEKEAAKNCTGISTYKAPELNLLEVR
jgi:hypothetical protein